MQAYSSFLEQLPPLQRKPLLCGYMLLLGRSCSCSVHTPQSLSSQLHSRVLEEWLTDCRARAYTKNVAAQDGVAHCQHRNQLQRGSCPCALYVLSPSPLCMDLVWQLGSYRCQGIQLRPRLASRLTGVRKLPCTQGSSSHQEFAASPCVHALLSSFLKYCIPYVCMHSTQQSVTIKYYTLAIGQWKHSYIQIIIKLICLRVK